MSVREAGETWKYACKLWENVIVEVWQKFTVRRNIVRIYFAKCVYGIS